VMRRRVPIRISKIEIRTLSITSSKYSQFFHLAEFCNSALVPDCE
jgi:hypothetical protein